MSAEAPTQPDGWTRLGHALGHFLAVLLRLLFVILLAVGVGAGVYYGVPYAYATLVQPVQNNTNQIALLNGKLDNLKSGIDASQSAQDARLTALETQTDSLRQRLDADESELATAKANLTAEQTARNDLAGQVADLKAQLSAQTSASAGLRADVDALKPSTAAAANQAAKLQQQISLLRLQNALLLARIQLNYQNLGDARAVMTTTVTAMRSFVQLPGVFSADDQASLNVRLVTAGALVEADPATALTDLESIWSQMDHTLSGGSAAAP